MKSISVGQKFSPNYIVKQLQILEAACNDNEIEIKQKFKIKKTEFDSIHLNEEQLSMIWNTKVTDKLENVKYLMMLMCYTGMRVQDALKYYNVKPTIIEDKAYLIYIMTKPPRKRCVIPLNISPILEAVVSKSIRKISEQNLRIYMKELCEVCGLNEPISMIRYTGTSSEVITKPFYEFGINPRIAFTFPTCHILLYSF